MSIQTCILECKHVIKQTSSIHKGREKYVQLLNKMKNDSKVENKITASFDFAQCFRDGDDIVQKNIPKYFRLISELGRTDVENQKLAAYHLLSNEIGYFLYYNDNSHLCDPQNKPTLNQYQYNQYHYPISLPSRSGSFYLYHKHPFPQIHSDNGKCMFVLADVIAGKIELEKKYINMENDYSILKTEYQKLSNRTTKLQSIIDDNKKLINQIEASIIETEKKYSNLKQALESSYEINNSLQNMNKYYDTCTCECKSVKEKELANNIESDVTIAIDDPFANSYTKRLELSNAELEKQCSNLKRMLESSFEKNAKLERENENMHMINTNISNIVVHNEKHSQLIMTQFESLMNNFERLKKDNEDIKSGIKNIQDNDCSKCVICLEYDKNIFYQPCGHIATCEKCIVKDFCPICRTGVEKCHKVFI